MRQWAEKILWSSANRLVRRDQPTIIAIGGGIAKTSTKIALGQILTAAWPDRVMVGYGNLNTYLGVPLAILGFRLDFHKKPLTNFGWLTTVLIAWLKHWFLRLPPYLVLEYGTDQPGDIVALVRQLPPHWSVLTIVAPAHVEKYGNLDKVAEDESALLKGTRSGGVVFVNTADPYLQLHRENAVGKKLIEVETKPELIAVSFARRVAQELGIDNEIIETALAKPIIAEQRFAIQKLRKYYVIDDSYNANPASMGAAFNVLAKAPGRKVAILGTMRELGDNAAQLHREVGKRAHEVADVVIGVGELSEHYSPIKVFADSDEAAAGIFPYLTEGVSILVKGSRGVHMEKIVEQIIKHGN